MAVMLDHQWSLSPLVALRPESFGALVYHFGNRKLTFLKQRRLAEVIRELEHRPTVRASLEAVGVEQSQWPAYLDALTALANNDVIRRNRARPVA